ncbi:MAG: S8 family serine peptidase, partial [Anaerolineae bacterium]
MRHALRRLGAAPRRGQGTAADSHLRKIIVLIALGALAAAMAGPAPTRAGSAPPPGPGPGAARVSASVLDAIARSGRAEVVVTLRDGVAPSAPDSVMAPGAARAQAAVLASLAPGDFDLVSRPTLLPIVAGTVTGRGLETLASHPLVAAVEGDELYWPLLAPRLAEAVPSVRADVVLARYGISGDGVTVAVLDTGIDNNHPDFEGKILAQHCYASSTRSCAPSGTGESDNAQDEYGHGTAVSGIILSPGRVSSPGVAPGADLVAVRVFRDTGTAATRDSISGLDFVMRHQGQYKIRIVNMSLGGGAGRGV